MASELSTHGFFSSELRFIPMYNQGYPTFLYLLRESFGSYYVHSAQLIQILAFSISIELIRRVSIQSFHFTQKASFVLCSFLVLSPAGFFYPQEAMYEALLFPLLACYTYCLIGSNSKSSFRYYAAGLLAALMLTIHERSLLIICVSTLLHHKALQKVFWKSFAFSLSIPIVFVVRNGLYYGTWRLSRGSGNVQENIIRIFNNRGQLDYSVYGGLGSENFFVNMWYFWTTYSGYGKNGTWYHNGTLDFFWNNFFNWESIRIVSLVISFMFLLLFMLGCFKLMVARYTIGLTLFLILFTSSILSGLSYGDSRHRLIFSPFIVLVIVWGLANKNKRIVYKFEKEQECL